MPIIDSQGEAIGVSKCDSALSFDIVGIALHVLIRIEVSVGEGQERCEKWSGGNWSVNIISVPKRPNKEVGLVVAGMGVAKSRHASVHDLCRDVAVEVLHIDEST